MSGDEPRLQSAMGYYSCRGIPNQAQDSQTPATMLALFKLSWRTRGTWDVLLYASYDGLEKWIGQRDISFSQNSVLGTLLPFLTPVSEASSAVCRNRIMQLLVLVPRTFTLVLPSSAICSFYLVSSLRQRQVARSNDLDIKCRVEFALRHTASRQARCRDARECMRVWAAEEDSKYSGPPRCAIAYGRFSFGLKFRSSGIPPLPFRSLRWKFPPSILQPRLSPKLPASTSI
ncbi:hypothetical protein ARMGADRAFT_1035367 [Armillaria gallica]|uniref:Uncharacterized protein n=1 Tax=Armillaria gallica TaxID=47427 RepID=A0A2H3DCM4_ARMGA|nr:hypothetical protein ARMGADRAFT_1035367 [Armillaria gallica]